LTSAAASLDLAELAAQGYWHSSLQRLPGFEMLLAGSLTGSQLLKLVENPAVTAVEEDQEYSILN